MHRFIIVLSFLFFIQIFSQKEDARMAYEKFDPDFDPDQYDPNVRYNEKDREATHESEPAQMFGGGTSIFDDPAFEEQHLSDFEFSDILSFPVPPASREYFYEDVSTVPSVMKAVIFVAYGGALDIDFSLVSPSGKILQQVSKKKEYFFLTNVTEVGRYTFEFSNSMSLITEKTVTFALHIDSKTDSHVPLTSDLLEPSTDMIENMKSRLQQMEHLQMYMKIREATHRNTAESTNTRVMAMTLLTMTILVVVKVVEVWYIQNMVSTQRHV